MKKLKRSTKRQENLRESAKLDYTGTTGKRKWVQQKWKLQPYFLNISQPSKQQRIKEDFKRKWETKQDLKEHYQIHRESTWKRLAKQAKKEKGRSTLNFLLLWESRLDVCLWKSKLVSTLKESRQRIVHGEIKVNGKESKRPGRTLKRADLVELSSHSLKTNPERLQKSAFFIGKHWEKRYGQMLCGRSHLEVDYMSQKIIYVEKPKKEELSYAFPIDWKKIPLKNK